YEAFPVSTATGEGLQPLLRRVMAILAELPAPEKEIVPPRERTREDERRWHAARLTDGSFAVRGGQIERIVAMTNFDNDEAVARLQRVLERTGISDRLRALGVRAGDAVQIGGHTLYWAAMPGDEIIDAPDEETDLWLAEE